MLTMTGKTLRIGLPNGAHHEFHAFWLRENSPDPDNIDPRTKHKLHDSAFFPLDIELTSARLEDRNVVLEFSDGHACTYSMEQLKSAALDPIPTDLPGEKTTWSADLDPLPWHDLGDLSEGTGVLAFLKDVARFGFALVRGVPLEPDGLHRLTDRLGFLRYTNSGGIADVKAVPVAYDLSMTARKLEPHVDNPYRYPQPGFTLLHCLRNDAVGGESILIDGFRVAEIIRNESKEYFDALSTIPIVYRYQDDQAILEYTAPFIDVWPDRSIKQTRFHGRCDQVVATDPDVLDIFYKARRRYAELIWSDKSQLVFKLEPGDMYFADNFRLFHGRRPFKLETGERHMRQAYMDRDVISSRHKTLMRDITSKPWEPRIH